jgi:CheY-like chemotaxis protein
MRRVPIVDDDPIGIANACRRASLLEGMLLLWSPQAARCPIRKARGRGETLQSPETTSIVDGKGCRPRPGRNQDRNSLEVIAFRGVLEFQLSQWGKLRAAHFRGVLNYRNRMFRLEEANMPRVLVVDDDPMVCMAIEIYLERHDFQVTIADGGEAGLRALEGAMFDLMIVDIFMPHMRGFESIRIFHERAPTIPLVAMSGYAFANINSPAPDFLRMALELGASRCLRKPFTPVALLAVINECISESQSRLTV